jgi:hypothetical protein
MNPLPRTLAFVVAAVLSVGAAGLTYYSNRPAKVTWDDEIGKEFYPNFQDPNDATSLQVSTFDKEASKTSTFSVEFKDGKWRIPSHNNYPADGKDRLKQTAASVIGIKRGTLAGTNKEAHKQHNLLDPLDQSINETEGRGDRITLKKGDTVLVDYIVGKKKEGPGNIYYIRKADEPSFFLSEVKIELSTKFGDWIEPDLLGLKRDDVKEIFLDRYSVNEAEGKIDQSEKSVLTRDSATADWKIEGIDTAAVKPKSSVISSMLGSLDDLKITGVRRKPEGLSASLQGDEAIKLTQSTLLDLQNHGYFYIPKKGIVSNEGDMLVSTFEGVSYVLRFGEVFEGSDVEVEVGSPNETTKKPAAEGEKKEGDKPAEEAKKDDAAADGEDKTSKKNRFVFIMAQHDPKLLGEPPVEPTKPEPPKEAAPAEAKPAAEGEAAKAEGDKAAEPAAQTPEAKAAADAKAAFDEAMKKYQTDSDVYRIKKKEYDEKLAAGEKRAKELNARFADWYYVISEDLFDELRVKSEDLVEPLPPPEKLPDTPPLPSIPKTEPEKEPAPEGDKPAAEKPAEEKPAEPAAPAEGDKPAEPVKPEADKPAEPPAAEAEKPATPEAPKPEAEKPAEPKAE